MSDSQELATLREITGLDLDDRRLREVLVAYGAVRREIAKLRELDLTEVHPAIVFDPTIGSSGKPPR